MTSSELASDIYPNLIICIFILLFLLSIFDATQWKRNREWRERGGMGGWSMDIVWISLTYTYYVMILIVDYNAYFQDYRDERKDCTFIVTHSQFVYIIFIVLTLRIYISTSSSRSNLIRACIYLSPLIALGTIVGTRVVEIPTKCASVGGEGGFVCGVQVPMYPFAIIFNCILAIFIPKRTVGDDPRFVVTLIFYLYIASVGIFGTFRDNQEFTLRRYLIQNMFTLCLTFVQYMIARHALTHAREEYVEQHREGEEGIALGEGQEDA